MKSLVKILVAIIFVLATSYANGVVAGETYDLPHYSHTYDPTQDPFSDLVLATYRAEENNRLILLIVGGYWCSWCYTLDKYLENNEEFTDLFYKTFEVVKIYYGPKNENKMFLSKLPKIKGYPHLFIMDSNFDLLGSQNTGILEKRNSFPLSPQHYKDKYMNEFLDKWANHLQKSLNKTLQPAPENSG